MGTIDDLLAWGSAVLAPPPGIAGDAFCRCDPTLAQQRASIRLGEARHPIHRDVINPALIKGIAATTREVRPLGLGAMLIEVDTTRTHDVDDLVRRAAAAMRDAELRSPRKRA